MANTQGNRYFPAPVMATLKPFAALRPKPELAAQICELPYDVMSSGEAREIAAGNPYSFLHVSKPALQLVFRCRFSRVRSIYGRFVRGLRATGQS